MRYVVETLWGGLRAQAQRINLLEMLFAVVLSGILSVVLFAIGQKKGRQAERKSIERDQQTHKDQTTIIMREMIKFLESAGLSRKQIESSVVQDAIQMSASTIIDAWKGPIAGSTVYCSPPGPIGTYTAGLVPRITEETKEQKEEDRED